MYIISGTASNTPRIARTASSPFISGIETSSTIKSGCNSRASAARKTHAAQEREAEERGHTIEAAEEKGIIGAELQSLPPRYVRELFPCQSRA